MNYASVYYDLPIITSNQIITKEPLLYKGSTTVNFVLTGVIEEMYDVLFLQIDWGDGTPKRTFQKDLIYDYREQSIFNEVLYGKIRGSIATFHSHEYANSLNSYNSSLTAQFLFIYNNGAHVHIIQPISIFSGSYYDEIGELSILNTQIVATSANNTFFNFEGRRNKQTFVGIMSAN
jgi:hypothetical protein